MPRAGDSLTGGKRTPTALRLGQDVLDRIDERAIDEGLVKANNKPNRSELIRVAVEYAFENMPHGWRPSEDTHAVGSYTLASAVEAANALTS